METVFKCLYLSGKSEYLLANIGKQQVASFAADKELHIQFFFQLLDRLTYRRLSNIEFFAASVRFPVSAVMIKICRLFFNIDLGKSLCGWWQKIIVVNNPVDQTS